VKRRKTRPVPIWGNGGEEIVSWGQVDEEDYEKVRYFKWWLADGYMAASITIDGFKTTMLLHRLVMDVPIGEGDVEVDHVNRDRLDNRKENLRRTTRWENEENHDRSGLSSQKRGVSFEKRTGRWRAQATVQGVYQHLGTYATEEEAIAARLAWEDRHDRVPKVERRRLFGEQDA
jgi:hypothetical protein